MSLFLLASPVWGLGATDTKIEWVSFKMSCVGSELSVVDAHSFFGKNVAHQRLPNCQQTICNRHLYHRYHGDNTLIMGMDGG